MFGKSSEIMFFELQNLPECSGNDPGQFWKFDFRRFSLIFGRRSRNSPKIVDISRYVAVFLDILTFFFDIFLKNFNLQLIDIRMKLKGFIQFSIFNLKVKTLFVMN